MQNEAGRQGVAAGLAPAVSWCWLVMYSKVLGAEQTLRPGRTQSCPCQRPCLSPTGQTPFPGQRHLGAMLPGAKSGEQGPVWKTEAAMLWERVAREGPRQWVEGVLCVCVAVHVHSLGRGCQHVVRVAVKGRIGGWVPVGVHGTVCHCVWGPPWRVGV